MCRWTSLCKGPNASTLVLIQLAEERCLPKLKFSIEVTYPCLPVYNTRNAHGKKQESMSSCSKRIKEPIICQQTHRHIVYKLSEGEYLGAFKLYSNFNFNNAGLVPVLLSRKERACASHQVGCYSRNAVKDSHGPGQGSNRRSAQILSTLCRCNY